MARSNQPFPPFVKIYSELGGIEVQPREYGLFVKFASVGVNRVSYTGNVKLIDYGRGNGFELGKENPRGETNQDNCRNFYDIRRDDCLAIAGGKISDAAFNKILTCVLGPANEWAQENPGLIRKAKLADINNKICAMEARRDKARSEYEALQSALDDLVATENAMLGG